MGTTTEYEIVARVADGRWDITIPPALLRHPEELGQGLRELGVPEDVIAELARTRSETELADLQGIAPTEPAKIPHLLKQAGIPREDWSQVHLGELSDPRVMRAIADRDAARAEIEVLVSQRFAVGRPVDADEVRDRQLAIATRWNAAIEHTRTMARLCEWCGQVCAFRHASSVVCSEKCGEAMKYARGAAAKKERRALK